MSILVVGSVALDSVKTPFGTAPNALGFRDVFFGIGVILRESEAGRGRGK